MFRRPALDASSSQALFLLRRIVLCLESTTGLERIWKRGLVHRGGPHYRLRGAVGPVSIGEDECLILGKVIERFRPAACFIIGNGFGFSSAFVAKMMEAHGGSTVITLDSKTEGDGERCFETAEKLRIEMDCRILRNKYGVSPRDVSPAAEGLEYDLIFIDGDHSHPQATDDFRSVQHLLQHEGIFCWHDYWFGGVPRSVEEAQKAGYRCLKLNSSSEMVLGTRDEAIFDGLKVLFTDAETPTPRRRHFARLMLSRSFVWAAIKARLGTR